MAHLKRILLSLSTIVLVASAVMGQSTIVADPVLTKPGKADPYWWSRYTVKGEEFSVKLPTLPAMTTSKVFQPRLGNHRLERHLKTSLEGVVYTIDVFENLKPAQSLEEFVAEQNADSTLDLKTARNLNVNGFAGKEYSSLNKTYPTTVQFFATEQRLYRFAASGPTNHPGVTHFFFSIALGEETGIRVEEGPGSPLELDTGERVYRGAELDTKVRLLNKPEPVVPSEARKNGTRGVVVLRALFSGDGTVRRIQVVSGAPDGLVDSAIDAARSIKFVPATKDGKPASMWMQLEYNFNY